MLAVKSEKKESRFQEALDYLVAYRGVVSAALIDRDGLLVEYKGSKSAEADALAPLSMLLLQNINVVLNRLGENEAAGVVIKTAESWLTIQTAGSLILVVVAGVETDDLLRVRIGRAVEMVKTHIQEKYSLQAY